jgi:membrane protein
MVAAGTPAQPDADHGANGLSAWCIPLGGWLDMARRMGREVLRDHVFIASSGIAFLALFALLPTLTALFSVYGLITSPQELSHQVQSLSSMAPHGVVKVLRGDMRGLVRGSGLQLGFSIVISVFVAVWVSVRGMLGIIGALNIVYGEDEKRSWLELFATALALALGALLFWLLALTVFVGAPLMIDHMASDSGVLRVLILVARWLIMAVTALISMTVLYRFGPSHTQPRWEWLSAGSCFGTALWLAGSAGLSIYISHVGHIGNVYGSLGAMMVVMTWFFLTAFVFLLGAEFNIEIQRQMRVHARG